MQRQGEIGASAAAVLRLLVMFAVRIDLPTETKEAIFGGVASATEGEPIYSAYNTPISVRGQAATGYRLLIYQPWLRG